MLNVLVRGTAEVLGKVATLLWTVAVARMLTTEELGAVTYALALMLLVSSLPSWGFDAGLVRRGSRGRDEVPRLYAAVQLWKTAIALPTYAVAALVVIPSRPGAGATTVVVLFLLAGFPEAWSSTCRAVAGTHERLAGTSAALVLQRVATAAAVLAAALAGGGIVGIAAGFLLGTTLGWVAHAVAVRRLGVRADWRGVTRSDLRRAARHTGLLGLSGIVLMLLFRLDAILLEAFKGDAAVAVYSVAYRLLETVLFVAYAINQAVLPVMSAANEDWRRRVGFARALAVGGVVYVPFIAVCALEGRSLVGLLFGQRYAEPAGQILVFLAPAALGYAVAFFASTLLMATMMNRAMLVSSLAATGVNLALNLVLIPAYGGVGAAVATTIAYVVQVAVSVTALRRRGIRLDLVRPLLVPIAATVPLAALLAVLDLPVLVELALGGLVYTAVWLALASRFAPEQRDLVALLVRRRAGRA